MDSKTSLPFKGRLPGSGKVPLLAASLFGKGKKVSLIIQHSWLENYKWRVQAEVLFPKKIPPSKVLGWWKMIKVAIVYFASKVERWNRNMLKDHCWLEAEARFDLRFNLIASGPDAIRAITMFCVSFWSSRVGSGLYLPLIYPWMVWKVTLLHASSWALIFWYALLTVEILWHRSDPTWKQGEGRPTFGFTPSNGNSMLHHGWTSWPGLLSGSGLGTKALRLWVVLRKKKMCVLKQRSIKGYQNLYKRDARTLCF